MDLWSGTGWSGIESLQRIESVTTRWILREARPRSFNVNGSRLWKLSPRTTRNYTFVSRETILDCKERRPISDDKSRIMNIINLNTWSFRLSRFVEICWKRRIRKNIPSPLMFLYRRLDRTREKFQTHPRFDSQRVSRFSPPQNDPPFDFCLNYPRFEPWKDDSRACNETLFLALRVPTRVHYHPQIFVSHFARKRSENNHYNE